MTKKNLSVISPEMIKTAEAIIAQRQEIRKLDKVSPNLGFNLPYKDFLKVMFAYFTSQSYGTRIQNRIISDFKLKKVPSKQDIGDCKNSRGHYIEIKIGFKDADENFHMVQIRPYQKVDYYLFQTIDPYTDFEIHNFIIPKDKIEDLIVRCGGSNCHGVSANKIDISMEEKRLTIKHSDVNWAYIVEKFEFDICRINSI